VKLTLPILLSLVYGIAVLLLAYVFDYRIESSEKKSIEIFIYSFMVAIVPIYVIVNFGLIIPIILLSLVSLLLLAGELRPGESEPIAVVYVSLWYIISALFIIASIAEYVLRSGISGIH